MKSASIDFGDWSQANLASNKLDVMLVALSQNKQMRTVSVGGDKRLYFTDGWATKHIEWDDKPAVSWAPEIVSMLLRCCHSLVELNLRCEN